MEKLMNEIYQVLVGACEAQAWGITFDVDSAQEDELYEQFCSLVGNEQAKVLWNEQYNKANAQVEGAWAKACKG